MKSKLIGNISIEQEPNGLLLLIHAKKGWHLPFIAAWLTFWLVAPFSSMVKAFHSLAQPKSADWFNLLWSVGWFFGIWFAVSTLAWGLGGVERLRVIPSQIEFTRSVFGVVFRSKVTPTAEVRNLRYMPGSPLGTRRTPQSCICYEDSNGTVRIGLGLDDAEALAIIEKMLVVYPFPKKDRALEYMDSR